MRTIICATTLVMLATIAPAGAGDFDSSTRSRELGTIRPLVPGSDNYQVRDKVGRLQGTAKPLYPGSDTLQLRDRTGQLQGTVKKSPNTGSSFVPRRDEWGRVDPLDRR
jgi:hypothetical protein